jgi:hypothetical protein
LPALLLSVPVQHHRVVIVWREEIVNDKAELVTRSGGVLREFELAVAPPDGSRAPCSHRENR